MNDEFKIEKLFKDFIYQLEFLENKKKHTIISIKNDVEQFLKFIFDKGIFEIEDIDEINIREFFFDLKKLDVTTSTYNIKIASIKKFFKYTSEQGIKKIEILMETERKDETKSIEYLTLSEVEKIRNVILENGYNFNSLRDRFLFELLYSTGLTVSEALSLSEINFDIDKREIYFLKNKEKRLVYFSEICKEYYVKFLEIKKEKFLEENSNIIFLNNSNTRLTDRSVRRIIGKYAEKTDISKEISPYTIRHTFCIHMLKNGMLKEYLAKLLGLRVSSLLNIYEDIIKKEILWHKKNV